MLSYDYNTLTHQHILTPSNALKMKTLLPFIAALLWAVSSLAGVLVPTERAPLIDHLLAINAEWGCQPEGTALLNFPASFATDNDRIQRHLQLVEQLLRDRSTAHLNARQRANRFRHLQHLRTYWQAGVFPENIHHSYRQPYFVDHRGTHCAVGHLMAENGDQEVVAAVQQQQNYGYVAELSIAFPVLPEWAEINGFTLEELAWIQPGYSPVSREWNAVGNGGGADGEILAMQAIGDEQLILAGQFSAVDGVAANNIIGWDGDEWFTLGEGLNGTVYDLALVFSNQIVAVGEFSLYDDPDRQNVALWDGEQWLGLQIGDMNGAVFTVTTLAYTSRLYLGGEFSMANGDPSYQNLAYLQYGWGSGLFSMWNDEGAFSVDGPVYDLQLNGEALLVAGEFSMTGTMSDNPEHILSAGNLAYWNDNEAWTTTLEVDLPVVRSVFIKDGFLYAGGGELGRIEVLNAGVWQPIGGVGPIQDVGSEHGIIHGFIPFNDGLYAYGNMNFYPNLGYFSRGLVGIQDNYGFGLALFNDEVKTSAAFQGELYVAGKFSAVDNQEVSGLAASDLLISEVDWIDGIFGVRVWSHGQTVYFETKDLTEEGQLAFYNVHGQLLQTRALAQGSQQFSIQLDYQGAVFCRVESGGAGKTYKLALF